MLIALVNSHGVNTNSMANFKLPTSCQLSDGSKICENCMIIFEKQYRPAPAHHCLKLSNEVENVPG